MVRRVQDTGRECSSSSHDLALATGSSKQRPTRGASLFLGQEGHATSFACFLPPFPRQLFPEKWLRSTRRGQSGTGHALPAQLSERGRRGGRQMEMPVFTTITNCSSLPAEMTGLSTLLSAGIGTQPLLGLSSGAQSPTTSAWGR